MATPHPALDRQGWLSLRLCVTRPVLDPLAAGRLRQRVPVETSPNHPEARPAVSPLEAFARSMAGLAPWLELEKGWTARKPPPSGKRARWPCSASGRRLEPVRTPPPPPAHFPKKMRNFACLPRPFRHF